MVNEYNTSQLNPFNFKKLVDVENNMLNGERLRQCSTAFEAPSILNDSSVDIVTKVYDRDAFGSVSICQKGAYKLLIKKTNFPV